MKIGDVEVIQLTEVECGAIIQSGMPAATAEKLQTMDWLRPHYMENGKFKAWVQSFLIKTKDFTILVDTCNGNEKKRTDVPEWNNLRTAFLDKLKEHVQLENIDYVLCTHLHMDHVGWNTTLVDGKWEPTFPNAKYLFAKKEFEYWQSQPEKEIADDHAGFADSVLPVVQANQALLVEADHKLCDEISFMPTPGHTPCHVSVNISSQGQEAIISGDMLHHPCQIADMTIGTVSDTYPEQAVSTRQELFGKIADTEVQLIGSHFADLVCGTIIKKEGKLEFKPTQ